MTERARKKILVLGMPYHARSLAEQLERFAAGQIEVQYAENPSQQQINTADILHLVSTPLPLLFKLRNAGKPMVYHWIGSDVLRLLQDSALKRLMKKALIKLTAARHVAVSEALCAELAAVGVDVEYLPMVQSEFPASPLPLPEKFAVLCYLPENRWSFYQGDLILQIAEALPEIDFHIVATSREGKTFPNLYFHGFLKNMEPPYARCHVLLRMPLHDGLPKMVLEALAYGRQVIWNYPFPHCRIAKDKSSAVGILRELSADIRLNREGHQFVKEQFHPEKMARDYLRFYLKLLEPGR